jgi:hypothetical protein
MKRIAGLICLSSVCAGVIFLEYEATSRFGGAFILITCASALGLLANALSRAPEGYEDANGLHFRRRNRRSDPSRRVRFSPGQLRRKWT